MNKKLTGYELSRDWFNWSFENPEKIKPNHGALYFYCIDHCNRMGWKEKFSLPTTMAKDGIGIKSYNTYIQTLRDLVEWGFIVMYQKSENQHTANIVGLLKFDKPLDKSLDKAITNHLTNHVSKQRETTSETTSETIDSIDKLLNNKLLNNKNNKNKGKEPPKKKAIDFSFVAAEYKKLFDEWIDHRVAGLKKPYKTQNGAKKAYQKLLELSNNSPEQAAKIVEHCIDNEWQAFFPLPSNGYKKIDKPLNEFTQ